MNNFKSIHLFHNGFSLAKVDSSNNIVFNTYKSASFAVLQRECGSFFGDGLNGEMPVILHPVPPVLVPRELYQSPATQYLVPIMELSENEAVLEDVIDDYLALYPFSQTIIMQLHTLGIQKRFHHLSKLMYLYLKRNFPTDSSQLLLYLSAGQADFVMLKENHLQIINSFNYTTVQDLLFFILNLLKQFELPLETTPVLLSGVLADSKKSFALLSQYIPLVNWVGEDKNISITNSAGTRVPHAACLPEVVLYNQF